MTYRVRRVHFDILDCHRFDRYITFTAQCKTYMYVFGCFSSKFALPYLKKSSNPHILNISPPLNMNPRWFKDHVGQFTHLTNRVDIVDRH